MTTPASGPTADPGSVAGSCERTLPGYPVLEPGAKGAAVRALQCFLNDGDYGPVAVDGVYGAQTRAAVKKVEASFEGPRPTPGRIDASMWVLLISRTLGTGTLKVGSKGAEVVTLQRALRAAGGTITVDGDFGAETKKVVAALPAGQPGRGRRCRRRRDALPAQDGRDDRLTRPNGRPTRRRTAQARRSSSQARARSKSSSEVPGRASGRPPSARG